MKKVLLSRLSTAALLTAAAIMVQPADTSAAGFYIREQGPNLGRAFAGDVAGGYDASTVYANPAGMMLLNCPEVEAGVSFIMGKTSFTPTLVSSDGSAVTSLPTGITTGLDNNGGNPFATEYVPNVYAVYPFNHVTFGLGITAPFGLKTEYDDAWIGRFDSIRSELKTVNIAPTIAFDVTDCLTFGIGVDLQYADAKLKKAKLFGGDEVRSDLNGTDWSFGVNTGVIFKAKENLNVGLNFRSGTSHSLNGNATNVAATGVAATDAIVNADLVAFGLDTFQARSDLDLPHIVTLGTSWDISPCWNLGAQVQWFNWNRFKSIDIVNVNNIDGAGIGAGNVIESVPQNFKNTFSFALGTEYDFSDGFSWQLGYLFDQTPTRDNFRGSAIPDANRNWLTTGVTWQFMPGVSANVGYAHIFVSDETINVTRDASIGFAVVNTTLAGTLDSHVDILSLNGRVEF